MKIFKFHYHKGHHIQHQHIRVLISDNKQHTRKIILVKVICHNISVFIVTK